MLEVAQLTIAKVAMLLCFVAAGYLLRVSGKLSENAGKILSALSAMIFCPAYNLRNLWMNFTVSKITENALILGYGLLITLLFIGLGLLCGSVFTDKQVGGICGALLTNLSAWLSGIWFDLTLVGGPLQRIANVLPFVHAVEMERAVLAGNFDQIFPHIWWVLGYAAVSLAAAIILFLRQMKKQ